VTDRADASSGHEDLGPQFYYTGAGFLFLVVALGLFVAGGFVNFEMTGVGLISNTNMTPAAMSVRLLNLYASPILFVLGGLACGAFGSSLLRAGGAATTRVIAPQDFDLLGPAVSQANADAITQWIRLNSLTGWVGFFTKIGLTGLPLATIVLTIFLALMGLANSAFFDLAKLTLGAFLGSFVQRQAERGTQGRT
jgi:hypothetical protein